jgi:type 1 glutamine amidotransferase
MLQLFRRLLLLALLLAVAALGYLSHIGAWHLVFPSDHHDTEPPRLPTELSAPAVVVFSKTNAFRHKEGIAGGQAALAEIAAGNGWDVFITENGAVFNPEMLNKFGAVVFLNASGDMLSAAQEQAFQAWLEGGGGWLGIHAAGDSSHAGWAWYSDTLIGAEFTAHTMGPQFQRATLLTENHQHPVNAGLPSLWQHVEEWYSFASSPRARGFTILATVDESTYTPVQKVFGSETDLRMGDHPVIWSTCVGAGRSVYSALGHQAEAFASPTYRRLLENALAWALGLRQGGC